ncbi:MAG: TetR/AcrR family transcriptional regulator [Solirubrobacteraceae bacterium]
MNVPRETAVPGAWLAQAGGAAVSRRAPLQRRSRERVESILTAAAQLLAEGGIDALTTRSLAVRAQIPVATIYRYFANREEIIAAYLDHELVLIDDAVVAAVLALERVTVRSLAEAVALAHMRHHQAHPEGVPVWFGGRLSPAVLGRVRELDERLADSLRSATRAAGLLTGAPAFSAELLVRLFDRMFEFVFLAERTAEEQETIVLSFVDMIATFLERFATPAGLQGISADEFALALREHLAGAERPSEPGSRE